MLFFMGFSVLGNDLNQLPSLPRFFQEAPAAAAAEAKVGTLVGEILPSYVGIIS